jgi:hypothetical protein
MNNKKIKIKKKRLHLNHRLGRAACTYGPEAG